MDDHDLVLKPIETSGPVTSGLVTWGILGIPHSKKPLMWVDLLVRTQPLFAGGAVAIFPFKLHQERSRPTTPAWTSWRWRIWAACWPDPWIWWWLLTCHGMPHHPPLVFPKGHHCWAQCQEGMNDMNMNIQDNLGTSPASGLGMILEKI